METVQIEHDQLTAQASEQAHPLNGRAMRSIQLSHDEFLMLLGFLRLPMPMALGTNPLEGYTDETLDAALASATTSLMARDYVLELPTDTTPAKLLPEVEDLITVSAMADSCLMIAAHKDEEQTTAHYSVRGGKAIVHTSPHEGVHRLERLPGPEAIVDHLVAAIEPHPTCTDSLTFTVAAEALGEAVDLATAGQPDAAAEALLDAGLPATAVDAFRSRMGSDIARYALVAVRELQSVHPLADSVVVLHGAQEDWYAEDDETREDSVRVTAVEADALRGRLAALMVPMQSSSPS
jgi:hypothetical protein